MKDLFLLIKSLKPTEKRYFTLSSNIMTPSKKSNYLRLFNDIDALDEYNEEEFLKKNRKEGYVKNFTVIKQHLHDFILEALRNYNEENIEEWKIRKKTYKLQLLASKGLDYECEQLINKTKEKAWQYEQYYALLEIIDIQLYLFGNCRIGNFEKDFFMKVQAEKEKILRINTDFSFVLSTWHQLNLIFINEMHQPFKDIKQQAANIINHPLMQIEPNPSLSLTLNNRYLACFELYYNSIGDAENCYQYNKKLLENRKLIDEKMPNFSTDAMAVYFNFMIACYKFEKWDEMEEYLIKTKDYPIGSIQQEIRQIHNYSYCGILLYLSTNQMEKAAILVDEFLLAKKKYEGRYRLDFLLFTLCQCGWYFFKMKDYERANEIWREISQGPRYNIEIRSQAMTKFYQLILYYTLGEFVLLQSEVANTRRYLKQNFLLNENETIFLTNFAKLTGNSEDKQILQNIIEAINNSEQVQTEKSVLNKFMIEYINNKYLVAK